MGILGGDTIKAIALATEGSCGLPDDVCDKLAPDVEYRIREIIQEAGKFMAHSKRKTMTTEDVSNALDMRNIEPIYGLGTSRVPIQFKQAANDLYYIDDKEVDLKEIMEAPPPRIPADVSFTAHWLAVEGVQPLIPQNPVPGPGQGSFVGASKASADMMMSGADRALMRTATTGLLPTTRVDALPGPDANVDPAAVQGGGKPPLVKHILSREIQIYYEKITSAITSDDETLRTLAIESVERDPGLHNLLPYLCQFASDQVTHRLKDLHGLKVAMRFTRALILNEYLFLEPYLHQLMPVILTCIVGKRLNKNADEDHWSLREYASSLIALICKNYSKAYKHLHSRVAKTLLRAFLDPSKPLTTHYGAVVGLRALGPVLVDTLIRPNLKVYMGLLNQHLEGPDGAAKADALRIKQALMAACGDLIRYESEISSASTAEETTPLRPSIKEQHNDMVNMFGEALLNFVPEPLPMGMPHI